MGSKSQPPPPPNIAPIAAASEHSANLAFQHSQEQLAFMKEQYNSDREITNAVIRDSIKRQNETDTQARRDRRRYERFYQPLENKLITESQGYTDERNRDRAEAAAGRAAADVSGQMAAARVAAQDRLESFGIDPSQTRAAALDVTARLTEAAQRAFAANQTREGVLRAEEGTGRALRSEALNIGRGYPGQIAQSYGIAMQSGNQAVNSGLTTTALGAQTMGTPVQWNAQGMSGLQNAGNTLNTGYKNSVDAWKAAQSQSSGWGSALGTLGGIFARPALGAMGLGFEEGGAVEQVGLPVGPRPTPGMGLPVGEHLSPSEGMDVDDVPARLNVGEFVLPADVVKWKGEEFLQNLISKSREKRKEAPGKPQVGVLPVERPALDTDQRAMA